jgi:methionyl-tRNA formyltransferase
MTTKPTYVFFGTPDVSSETLELLFDHGHIPDLIVTAPDRPVGRHFIMTASPTKAWAIEHNIPYIQPEKITPEIIETLPITDLYIVVAYGKILSQKLIDRPKIATINVHYSLLPRWRGASPVEAAILHGDKETGVSIQKMVFKLDAGPVIAEKQITIDSDDTTPTLRGKLISLGARLLANLMSEQDPPLLAREALAVRIAQSTEQDESFATHCGKTKKEDGLINPEHDDPEIMYRKYRAYQPWPGLYFIRDGKRIKITKAHYDQGVFKIDRVIREGEKESNWSR